MSMSIDEVENDGILFSNGAAIIIDPFPKSARSNIELLAKVLTNINFDEPLHFDKSTATAFRFGNKPNRMFICFCYVDGDVGYDTFDVFYRPPNTLEWQKVVEDVGFRRIEDTEDAGNDILTLIC